MAFGIAISIPIIVWGRQFVLKLMDRFPLVITLGGGRLGWIGGSMLLGDTALVSRPRHLPLWSHPLAGLVGAALVMLSGTWPARRQQGLSTVPADERG
ncbi:hypothetical protein SAMN02745746_00682 [Pseudogulbenkiania subflava DSM 22618]|uniref:Uncharacterized protein n=1 Tax=Pseudogulbenkiania subflava DSM 22618 TaxID=1123014 RepID=A0A1Y6BF87_9NEIS|nr:hypothetical protein SAMN02745746_00682 [Pseudogulbenkiania subflava DSM 22618]